MPRQKGGFTLVELTIVIIIIGILAGLAIPKFIRMAERAKGDEALAQVGAVRGSMQRYYASDQSYTGATLTTLDIDDPGSSSVYPGALFDYALTVAASAFTCVATRNTTKGGDGTSTITITEDGTISGTGDFAGVR